MEEQQRLKAELHKQAGLVAEKLKRDPGALAVILTGPLAMGRVSEKDKLYLALITGREDGVIEHHFLDDGWGEVKRPIELAKFPLAVARYLIKHGYNDMVSYKSLEAFRCGEVLWQKEGIGTEMVRGAEKHIPAKVFVGESLHGAVSALDDAVSLMKNGDYANAVIVAREAASKAVAMMVKQELRESKESFLEAAAKLLPAEQLELYREIMDLKGVDAGRAEESARQAREFAEYTLRQIGVDPEHVFTAASKERPE